MEKGNVFSVLVDYVIFSLRHDLTSYLGDYCNFTNPTQCYSCTRPYLRLANSTCIKECSSGQYKDSSSCKNCTVSNCDDCIYKSPEIGKYCEVCQSGYAKIKALDACILETSCDTQAGYILQTGLTRYDGLSYKACMPCSVDNCKSLTIKSRSNSGKVSTVLGTLTLAVSVMTLVTLCFYEMMGRNVCQHVQMALV